MNELWIGIDVGKTAVDVAFAGRCDVERVSRTEEALREWVVKVRSERGS